MLNEQTAKKEKVSFGLDSVVVRKCLSDIQGGRTLDCTGYDKDTLLAGHVIIRKSDGTYAPMPVAGDAYAALPAGAAFAGILKDSLAVSNPAAAIMTAGSVNPEVLPYPMTDILADFKAAFPTIIFEQDEEA